MRRPRPVPGPLDLNAAAVRELTQLPGVGVDTARRIVARRAARRGFRDWSDFAATPGVRPDDAEAIRGRADIGPLPGDLPGRDRARRSRRTGNLAGSAASFWRRRRGGR
jgi:hypothetical protein